MKTTPLHTYRKLYAHGLFTLIGIIQVIFDRLSICTVTSDNFYNTLCPRHRQTSNLDLGFASVKIACLQVARTQIIGSLSSAFVQIVSKFLICKNL